MPALTGWENFYVIVGSSAGALIGLQFVVLTLIAENPIVGDLKRASGAFATPTIVHFGVVLLLSAVISVPWHGIAPAAILWGVLGLVGLIYVLIVARRSECKPPTHPSSRTGCFMFCCRSRPMRRSSDRPVRLARMSAGRFSASARRRSCCSSSAFITPGMPSHTTCLSGSRGNVRLSGVTE